jgi:arginine N-succinyltransferase
MATIDTLCTILSGLNVSVSSAGLTESGIHPLSQPTILLRETLPADAPYLIETARAANFRSVNFPTDLAGMLRKIGRSQASFRGGVSNLSEQEIMFSVLAPTDQRTFVPIGTSTFYPQHGSPQKPHHAYQVVSGTRFDGSEVQDDACLHLIQNHAGPAEAGALVVHPAAQGSSKGRRTFSYFAEGFCHLLKLDSGYGRAASWVRFFWAALPGRRDAYADRSCLTEILPPFDEAPGGARTNAFYEAHARKYFDGRPYDEMDELTNEDRSLIAARLPKLARLADLPPAARAIIGKPRDGSLPALKLLERLGFKPTYQVDPIDGGPHLVGAFTDNPIFLGAKDYLYGGTASREDELPQWHYGFVGLSDPSGETAFRAALSAFLVMEDLILTTLPAADFLELKMGSMEKLTAVAL